MLGWSILIGRGAAATLDVGPSGTYATVQDALAVAADGDTIEISAGTWNGPFVLGEIELEIVGVDGSAATRLVPSTPGVPDNATVLVNSQSPVTLRGLTIDGGDQQRGMFVRNGDVFGEDLVFVGGVGEYGSDLSIRESDLTLVGASFDYPHSTLTGGHAEVISSTLDFESVSFSNAVTIDGIGGGMYMYDTSATFRNCTFHDNSAAEGGALFVEAVPSNLIVLEDTVMERNSATSGPGGTVFQLDGQLQITRTTIRDSDATDVGGAVMHLGGRDFRIEDSRIEGSHSVLGGGISLLDGSGAAVLRSTFVDNRSDGDGGGLLILGLTGDADVGGNTFCGNDAISGGGLQANATADLSATIHHNVFIGNDASLQGGAVSLVGIAADFVQNTIVDSSTEGDRGALYVGTTTTASAYNNVYAYNVGKGVYIDAESWQYGGYNVYFDNDVNIGSPDGDANDGSWSDLRANPEFRRYAAGDCTSNLRPTAGSPLVDAGEPTAFDDDGSRSDIGAFGGAGASEVVDVDEDGVIVGDCAPFDPDKLTGSDEIVADGVDQDCDGLDLCWADGDGDGVGVDEVVAGPIGCDGPGLAPTNGDCDDADPELAADCSPPDDDTGEAPPTEEEPPENIAPDLRRAWFCSVAGGPPAPSIGLLLAGWLLLRRRARPGTRDGTAS